MCDSVLRRGLIVTLFILGFLLRLYPIFWGSIHHDRSQYSLHGDEPKMVRYVDDFPESLKTNHDYRYPTFVQNVYGALWAGVGGIAGLRDPAPSKVATESYEAALLFGRALNVLLFGLGGMWLTWRFARRLFGEDVGLWTLALLNVLPMPVTSAALVQADVASSVGLLLVFYLLLRVSCAERVRVSEGVWIGLALGAAISMKYTAAVGAAAVAAVAVHAAVRGAAPRLGALKFLAAATLATLVAFALFVPGAVFDFASFVESIRYEFQDKSLAHSFKAGNFVGRFENCFTWWVLIPAAGGLVYGLRYRRTLFLLALLACVVAYLLVTAAAFKDYYGILIAPYVATLAGLGLSRMVTWRPRRATFAAAAILILAGHGYTAWVVQQRYAGDTRYQFQAWVEENVTPPGPIGEGPRPTRASNFCPREPLGYRFISALERPEWVVLTRREYFHIDRAIRDGSFMEGAEGQRTLGPLVEGDFLFYEDVLHQLRRDYRYDPVVVFEPRDLPLEMQGKTVRIYRRSEEEQ